MYFRVPQDLQEPLLRNIKGSRLRSYLLYFPLLLLIFLAVGAGLVFIRGHLEVQALRGILSDLLPDRVLWPLLWAVVIVGGTGALLFFLWQMYRDCSVETYLFCESCKAVDSDETGHCPVCSQELSETAGFFYTSYSHEEKLLERRGLQAYRKN